MVAMKKSLVACKGYEVCHLKGGSEILVFLGVLILRTRVFHIELSSVVLKEQCPSRNIHIYD